MNTASTALASLIFGVLISFAVAAPVQPKCCEVEANGCPMAVCEPTNWFGQNGFMKSIQTYPFPYCANTADILYTCQEKQVQAGNEEFDCADIAFYLLLDDCELDENRVGVGQKKRPGCTATSIECRTIV